MENFVVLLIPAMLAVILVRALLLPMKILYKLAIHGGCGFLCLWLLNAISGFTGIHFPINMVTILIAGFLGVPGMGFLALLEIMP